MYIFGRQPVLEALKSDKRIAKIYIQFGTHGEIIGQITRRARELKVPFVELSKQKFQRIGDVQNSQGVAALIEDIQTCELDDVFDNIPVDEKPFLLALDSIEDPHNIGALMRTAECSGVHGIIIPKHRSAPITDVVLKTSAGAASHVRIVRTSNLAITLNELKRNNIWIVGLDEDGATDLFDFDSNIPLCIVIGNEAKGMRPIIRKLCDYTIRIPMWGKISSLNASVAGALMMYEVRRKRKPN